MEKVNACFHFGCLGGVRVLCGCCSNVVWGPCWCCLDVFLGTGRCSFRPEDQASCCPCAGIQFCGGITQIPPSSACRAYASRTCRKAKLSRQGTDHQRTVRKRKRVERQSCRNKAPTSKAHYATEHKWKGKKLPKQGTDQQSTRRGRKRVERQSCRNKAPIGFLDSTDAV